MEDDGMTPEELDALADGLAVNYPRSLLIQSITVDISRAAAALRAQAEAVRERDALHAAGCDLVALVELLAGEHVAPTTMTPFMRVLIRARLNKHRNVLGIEKGEGE